MIEGIAATYASNLGYFDCHIRISNETGEEDNDRKAARLTEILEEGGKRVVKIPQVYPAEGKIIKPEERRIIIYSIKGKKTKRKDAKYEEPGSSLKILF